MLRQADKRIGLLKRLAGCFTDCRRADRVEHPLGEMLAQRIYGLALGYEDLNDHEQLRHDPLMAVLAGKKKIGQQLAAKSTLNRLELSPAGDNSMRFSVLLPANCCLTFFFPASTAISGSCRNCSWSFRSS